MFPKKSRKIPAKFTQDLPAKNKKKFNDELLQAHRQKRRRHSEKLSSKEVFVGEAIFVLWLLEVCFQTSSETLSPLLPFDMLDTLRCPFACVWTTTIALCNLLILFPRSPSTLAPNPANPPL